MSADLREDHDANGERGAATGGDNNASSPQPGLEPEASNTPRSVAERLQRAQSQLMQAHYTRQEAASELEFSEKAVSTSYAAAMRSAETQQQAVRPHHHVSHPGRAEASCGCSEDCCVYVCVWAGTQADGSGVESRGVESGRGSGEPPSMIQNYALHAQLPPGWRGCPHAQPGCPTREAPPQLHPQGISTY